MTETHGRPPHPAAGSNVKGRAAGAAWTYLLDDLSVGTVTCIGEPSAAALTTLERLAEHVVIVGRASADRGDVRRVESAGGLPAASADLVYLVDRSPRSREAAIRVLKNNGQLYVEIRGRRGERHLEAWLQDAGLHVARRYWLTPATGEARSAVPAQDRVTRRFFVARGISVPSFHRALRFVERRAATGASRHRTGLLLSRRPSNSTVVASLPKYLRDVAVRAGRDLDGYRFGLSARGQYNSRKVLFYLFPPGSPRPDLIVKTTRDRALNDRLEVEERMLRRVADEELVPAGTAPGVAFAGEHGGLRILGETILEGASLWNGASGTAAAHAYEWLTALAERTARRGPRAADDIRARLAEVVDGVQQSYRLTPSERAELQRLVDSVQLHVEQLPLVLAHGDAATWNGVRLADGGVGFLDWEAARFDGVPLWDLWYFARSRHMTATRLRRRLGLPRPGVVSAIRSDAELRRAMRTYLSVMGIPGEVVRPLFVLCWADRAIREVTRLEADDVASGHYIGLVRQLLGDRTSSP